MAKKPVTYLLTDMLADLSTSLCAEHKLGWRIPKSNERMNDQIEILPQSPPQI
jgi:hypothetical protein